MRFLKQSTSVDVPIGPFLDETDGKTAETALTITQPDIRLKKNGGAWAQKAAAQTLSHEEAGWYEVTLDATDTDTVGHLIVAVHESGALPVWIEFTVLETAVYDALFADAAPGYLQPTTAGRTLDVTATGAAGVDWGNVENQSSAVNLSGSSIGTAAAVTAIDTGGIVAASFAAGAIDAAAIAADAIGASELAADAVAEIADAVWDEARSGHTTQGSFGEVNQSVRSFTAQGGGTNTITLDASASAVDDFYNGSLVWLLKNTGAGQAGVITDYNGTTKVATVDNNWRTNPDATTEGVLLPGSLGLTSATLASAVWDAATASYTTAGTFGKAVSDILDDTGTSGVIVASLAAGSITAAVVATGAIDADAIAADAVTEIQSGLALSTQVDALEAAVIAIEADTQDIQARIPAALTAGGNMKADALAISGDTVAADNLEAALDGTGGVTITAALTGNITGNLSGSVGSVTGAVGSVTGNVGGDVVGSVASVTGAVGSVTGNVGGNVVGSVASVTGAVGSVTGNIGGNLLGTLSTTERDAIATALLDLAAGIETGLTLRQALRLVCATGGGKLSGAGTATEVFRNAVADSKARVTATVDASGNRSAITYDLT